MAGPIKQWKAKQSPQFDHLHWQNYSLWYHQYNKRNMARSAKKNKTSIFIYVMSFLLHFSLRSTAACHACFINCIEQCAKLQIFRGLGGFFGHFLSMRLKIVSLICGSKQNSEPWQENTVCLCFFLPPLAPSRLVLIKTNWVVNLICSQKLPYQRRRERHF